MLADDIQKYLVYVDERLKKEEKAIAEKKRLEQNIEEGVETKVKTEDTESGVIVPSQSDALPTMVLGVEQVTQGETSVPSLDSLGEINADKLEVNLLRQNNDKPTATGTIIKR